MSKEEEDNDELLLLLIGVGFSQSVSIGIIQSIASDKTKIVQLLAQKDPQALLSTIDEVIPNPTKELAKEKEKLKTKQTTLDKPQVSGLLSILLSVGFGAALAIAITEATSEEEKIPMFIKDKKTPVIFMTQMDSKVDDKICLPLEGTVWDEKDPKRPKIPSDLHLHCRCFYIDAITGQNLGQI